MPKSAELIVHETIDQIVNCHITLREASGNLPMHFMELAHALLPRVAGSKASCCTLADLLTAAYQLGMSRALASVAAGLGGER